MSKLRGFTLIELLVGMAITGTISLIAVGIGLGGAESFTNLQFTQARTSAFFELFSRTDNFVRIATAFPTEYIDVPNQKTYTADANTLIMALHGQSIQDGALCNYTDYVVYDWQDGTLSELLFADPNSSRQSYDRIVARDVTEVVYTQEKNGTEHRKVTLTATIAQTQFTRTLSQTHEQTMVARND